MGFLNAVGRRVGDAASGVGNKLRWNAGFHGAGSNAVLGALFGAGSAGVGGGDIHDVGRGAALGALGGAAGATMGIPGAAIAGVPAGLAGGLSQVQDAPAEARRAESMAREALRDAASMSDQLDEKSIATAIQQRYGGMSPEAQQQIYAMAIRLAGGQ